MKEIRFLFFFLGCMLLKNSGAQSYLPNTDFSDLNICCEYRVSCAPMGWWTTSGGTFNFKPILYKNRKPVPMPAYIRMQGQEGINERSYIQAPLLCPLKAGETYEIDIEYSFPDRSYPELGLYFSDTFVHIPRKTVYEVDSLTGSFRKHEIDSMLPFVPSEVFQLNAGWIRTGTYRTRISYKAHGNEKFLILGNFSDDMGSSAIKGPFNANEGRHDLLAIHHIHLTSVSGIPCECEQQIEILETLNRRHSYYGACHDSLEIDMNRLFVSIPGWQEETTRTHSSGTADPFEAGRPYRIEGIYFDFDSSVLRPESYPALDSLSDILLTYADFRIEILGHTDSLGSQEYNDSLSLHRAQAVRNYLILKGIHPEKITAQGRGSNYPVQSNGDEKGRQKNRRVEFILRQESRHIR